MLARPIKDGAIYFPKDTDFYADDKIKLLRTEFGAKGMYILDYLLCDLYGKNGYFIKWDVDKCFLVSDGAGCGCTPAFIAEVVQGCIRRSFFDKRVFDTFGVLTSAGIQRRYIRMVSSRDEIRINKAFFLLDAHDKNDVPEKALNKLTLFTDNFIENPDNFIENPDKNKIYPQIKGNEIKGNKIKGESVSARFAKPTLQDVKDYCSSRNNSINAEHFIDYYESNGWKVGKNPMKDWRAAVRTWEKREKENKKPDTSGNAQPSYDLKSVAEEAMKRIGGYAK